jgi:hypothetical protein
MRRVTLQFLRQLQASKHFISQIVLDEVGVCEDAVYGEIIELIESAAPMILEVTPECSELARFYIESGILPVKKSADAMQVAVSTFWEMDVLVSWNHRHMANLRKAEQYRGANLMRGYWKTPSILTPLEVIHG